MATQGQVSIVLPAQFNSLAAVYKNGDRQFQTVDFNYASDTKTLDFTTVLSQNDIVLVDVGMVPDAVLADLLAIQKDITVKQTDVTNSKAVVTSKHSDVVEKHDEVNNWQQQVSLDKDKTVEAKNETLKSKSATAKVVSGSSCKSADYG